ncbi:hypothetical protein [Actinokineospora cianjurensis]|uniref:Uncharacterized protein n=1 Tax=Actinokineospora cianjurensis TaxID=585224 RepID=A0A421AWM9_9PSEU|nr:hypothetical protein [Actinokineospora cianjurensis]RLK54017.1 hypothetical protein CLV68_6018 [Actinokineospora cianjurensis]
MTTPGQVIPPRPTAGAGIFDSGALLFEDINALSTAQGEDIAAFLVAVGVDAVALAFDVAKLVINPLGSLIAAGLGWVMEHFEPVRTLLTWVAGDPDQAMLTARHMHSLSKSFTQVHEKFGAQRAVIDPWHGLAAEACKKHMDHHHTELAVLAATADAIGYIVHTSAVVVAVVRALVRDLIATLVGDAIAVGLTALALAPITGGTSIAGFLGWLWTSISLTCGKALTAILKAVGLMERSAARMSSLSRVPSAARSNPGHSAAAGHAPASVRPASAAPIRRAESVPVTRVEPAPVPVRRASVSGGLPPGRAYSPPNGWLKGHERLFRQRAPQAWSRYKRSEVRIREHWRKSYPALRKMADLDSSKEYIGWAVKAGTRGAHDMSEIRWSARQGWTAQHNNPHQP